MKTFHMKKMYKKVTAFILAITMIVAYIQIKAYAFDNNVSEITRNQAVSDATIQSGLGVAKNYGLFSLDATSHNDLECSVAAKYADLGADYNFSGNNTKVYKNQLTVSKSFMINNQPQANKNVTLRLYRMDSSQSVLIDEMTQTTDSNGNAKFVFDGMKDSSSNKRYSFIDGDYQVKEVISENGVEKEIIPDGSSYIDENGNKIEVNADHSGLIHLESGFQNVSQFGQVKNHSIFKPRNGSIVVLENQDDWNAVDKEAINQGKNNYRNVPAGVTYYNNGEVKIIKAGTNGFQPIAWDQEFDNLKTLSKNLAHAQDSNDVQVYYYNADYLKSVGSLNFDTSKKWAVVNVEVQDGQSTIDITGDYTKNGNKLDADFDNLETGVIWNFYTVNNGDVQPYTGKVTLANQNGGIFLLPAGEFYHNGTIGGKVIAAKYNHDNEIHQKEKVVNVNNSLSMSNNGASEKLEAKQTISGTKKLIGKELQGNDFKFELQKYTDSSYSTPDGEAVVTTNNEKGQFVFSDEDILTYTEPGDYYYIVKEVNDGKNHVQYDSHTFKVSIHVEKQDNALIADDPVVEGGKIEFSNEFKFEGNASLSLVGKKVLNGKKLENDEFTYGLQEYKDSEYSTKEGHEKEVTNDQKGNIQVDLSYDEKDIGKHYYQLKEKNTKKKGIDYDQRIYSIIVDVQYDESKDQLVVSKTITVDGESVDSITFENTYSSNAATTFKGHKILEGRDLNANEFNFVLQETKSDYQTAIGESKTVSNDSQGDFNFGKISYRDLTYGEKQIHYYIIKEVNPVLQGTYQGVSYDQKVYKIKVVVTDQKDGTATVERTVENNDIQFKNTYQAEGSTTLIIHKQLTGGTLKANMFKFKLQQTDEKFKKTVGNNQTVTNSSLGQGQFVIHFNQAGTYYYTVSEVNNHKSNVTYDSIVYQIKIKTEDDGQGNIKEVSRSISYVDEMTKPTSEEKENLTFKNAVGIQVVGHKKLINKKLEEGMFTFSISKIDYDKNNNKYTVEKQLMTTTNDENGDFSFINFDEYHQTGDYYYVVKEVNNKLSYIDYDKQEYIIHVSVENGDDGLEVSKEILKDNTSVDEMNFKNTYRGQGKVRIDGKKVLLDQGVSQVLSGGEFKFKITRVNDEKGSLYKGEILDSIEKETVKNDQNGQFKFNISYKDLDFSKKDSYTFYYQIDEESSGLTKDGVTYNKNNDAYIIEVTVSDQQDGNYDVSYRIIDHDEMIFTNEYNASGETQIIGTKSLKGKKLVDDEFTFELVEVDGIQGKEKENGRKLETTNKEGQFIFDIQDIRKAGTTYYKVYEKADKKKTGIQYDETVYYVEAKAVFEDNQLKVTNTLYDQDGHQLDKNKGIEFENEFKATGKIDLSGHKNFIDQDGQDVAFDAGDFKFKIEELDQDGATLKKDGYSETVENDQDGNYHFKTIHYQKAGIYYYRVSEVRDNLEVTYDTTQYIVKVDVKANDSKQFDISVDIVNGQNEHIDQDKLNFTNRLFEYKVALLSMGGIKTVSAGQSVIMDDGLFRFGLYEGNDNEQSNMIDTAKNDTVGAYSFDDVEIDQPGTYHYTIEEMNAGKEVAGIAYTNHQYHVEAVVNKDGKGGLNVDSVKVTNENNQVVKDQSVVVKTSQDLSLTNQAVKSLKVNKVWNDQGHSDTIQPVTVHLVKNGKVVEGQSIVLSNDNQWSGSFDNLPIKDSQGNLNVYTVKEDKVDYYKTQYIQNEDGSITITNTYIDPTAVDVQLVAKKNLVGGKVLSAGMYQFDLLDGNNEVVETQTNDDQGNIYFNTLNFNQEGHYVYYIQEHVNDNDPFVEYDQSIYQVNIDVSRNGNNLQAEVEYLLDDKQVDDVTFNNIYHPLSLTVQKRSKDLSKDPLEGAVYGLYKVNEKGTDILIEKQTSNSEGYMTFMKAVPEYQYYFKEISAPNGHTVDEYKTKTFTIKWIRHKNGKISYKLIYDGQKEDLEEEKQEDSLNLYAQQSIALLENEDTSVNLEAIGVADEVTKLNVTKVDNQGNYLTGAHLQILGKETYLRRYIDSMNLKFHKTGDTYKLTSVIDTAQNNKEVTTSGSNFFPLNDYSTEGTPNYFFGMRYDVEFAIGDYVGDLTYKFTGDDDMWVVLDNTNVIIDLGGIHAAATDSVDLWSKLGLTPGSLTEDQKNQTHKLTILYMERGAGESNCQMEFTLPNAKVVDVIEKPKADLNLQKVDENGNGLSDAVFKLENDSTKEASRVKSTSDGNITFSGLKEGTYTLTEVSAPDGYLVSDDTWKVRVTVDSNNNAVAKLYLVKDDQEQEVAQTNGKYKIENKKVQEIIENSLQYDKTAKVKDWDERTYDINITAKSLSTSSSVVQKEAVADIMMVLDISGSMLYNGNSNNPTDNGGFRTVGKYCDVKNSLDVNKVYYYDNTLTDVSYKHTNGNSYTYKNAKYPMIYINDTWKYYNGSSWVNVPDKISGYYGNKKDNNTTIYTLDSGLTGLKEASSAFISATAESSENSRIGVATFNAYGNNLSNLVNARDNKNSLKQTIASIYAAGGTSPQKGLSIAQTNLANSKRTDVPQYVILFTDGAPSEDTDKNDSKEIARQLRESGITVYTVGLKLNDETSNWLSENIASTNCAFTAANVDELKVIFAKIQQTISQNIDIKNANIFDVIDPRFQLVGNDGNVITDEALKQGEIEVTGTNGKVGMAYYDEVNNTQAIRWTDQTIPNVNTGEWNTTITVKARDKYIGGNNVPTNVSPDSKITTGFGEAVLPQPKVNVKVDIATSNDDIWINSGETVPVDDTNIGNSKVFDIGNVVNSKGNVVYKYNESTKEFEKITKGDLTIQWYTDDQCTSETTKDKISKVKPDGRTDFFLKVGYDGGSATDESNTNTNGNKVGNSESNIGYAINDGKNGNDKECVTDFENCKKNKSEYGIYRIHVKYTLPETGGTGIYWYMAGGMLLMMVAAVAIYRKRYYEYMNK